MNRGRLPVLALSAVLAQGLALAQAKPAKTMTHGPHRMEIMLERHENGGWHTIDPGLVLAQGDQVRFRYRTNFDGYLYVTNQNSSGQYQQLFPLQETGQDNRVVSGKEYQVPATSMVFTIAGPAGFETVYWLVTPARLSEAPPRMRPIPPDYKNPTPNGALTPRCDDTIWRARGDCIDNSAGPKLVPRGEQLPEALAGAADQTSRDLFFMRQNDKAVISSPAPLAGPVVYEFRLAHR
ncbi:MAG TPA: DUF4384 domain-containing protein [Bryobacteraceae bacterium]|jgi:hypothetical protein